MMTDGILAAQLSGGGIGTRGGLGADSAQQFQDAYNAATNRIDATASEPTGSGDVFTVESAARPQFGFACASSQQADHATQTEMKPSELMQFTMRSHEFLFHCELVANVANRSSDGMQQLFRQQS